MTPHVCKKSQTVKSTKALGTANNQERIFGLSFNWTQNRPSYCSVLHPSLHVIEGDPNQQCTNMPSSLDDHCQRSQKAIVTSLLSVQMFQCHTIL